MRFRQWVKEATRKAARALDPQNMIDLLAKVINDLRVAASDSSRATVRLFLSFPLAILCGLLYALKGMKWFLRVFHRLVTIALEEIAFHTTFLARSSTGLKSAWEEVQEALERNASRLCKEILNRPTKQPNEDTPSFLALLGQAAVCTGCWVPRLLEAVVAVGWAVVAVGGLTFVLIMRRSIPLEIGGAAALLVVPPLLQHAIRSQPAAQPSESGEGVERST